MAMKVPLIIAFVLVLSVEFANGFWKSKLHRKLSKSNLPNEKFAEKNESTLFDKNIKCSSYHDHSNVSDRCWYVKHVNECSFDDGYIQYIHFVFCSFKPPYLNAGCVLMALWLLYLFIGLGVTAEEFFCPCLKTVSRVLHLSDSVAGVTLLALGNGAPDIFSVMAAVNNEDPTATEMAFQELFGAGIFVTTVVSGCINIVSSFKMARRPFLRDCVFYLLAVTWTFTVMYKQRINITEAVGFIILYAIYVLLVVIGQFVNRYIRRRASSTRALEPVVDEDSLTYTPPIIQDLTESADFTSYNYSNDHAHLYHENRYRNVENLQQPGNVNAEASYNSSYENVLDRNDNNDEDSVFFTESDWYHTSFVERLTGIKAIEWKLNSLPAKMFAIIKVPLLFSIGLTCPIVDTDVQGEKWNKLLTCVQCVISPIFLIFVVDKAFVTVYKDFLLWHFLLIVGSMLAITLYFSTSNQSTPRFHAIFAVAGFIVAVLWIKSFAQEIVNLLETFGWISNISYGIMGLTFLAWGNSIGDFISNLTMAKHGAPRMAIAACYGGPLLNMLLGVGISCGVTAASNHGHKKLIRGTTQYIISTGYLLLTILSALLIFPCTGFRTSKCVGIYLLFVYASYLTLSILHEAHFFKFSF